MPPSKIVWSVESIQQMADAIRYIQKDSIQNADAVYNKIMAKLVVVAENPEMCPQDKHKIKNDGSFRELIMFRYRISYKVYKDKIRILRVRHTSMKPKQY